jgi:hypothetical protein
LIFHVIVWVMSCPLDQAPPAANHTRRSDQPSLRKPHPSIFVAAISLTS